MERSPIVSLAALAPGEVQVAGRIIAQSEQLALLRDESGSVRLLATAAPMLNALVRARGHWNGDAIEVAELELAQAALTGEPHELRELAGSNNLKQRRLRERAHILRSVRGFFEARGFLEVETPLVVPCPGLDLHLDALAVTTRTGTRFLITSPEYQMKRLLAGGLERIFQIAKCFRNDELGERHQPEFTMLEADSSFKQGVAPHPSRHLTPRGPGGPCGGQYASARSPPIVSLLQATCRAFAYARLGRVPQRQRHAAFEFPSGMKEVPPPCRRRG